MTSAEDEDKSEVLEAVKDDLEIVPYTKRDRNVNYFIAVIVAANLAVVLLQIPWGSIW